MVVCGCASSRRQRDAHDWRERKRDSLSGIGQRPGLRQQHSYVFVLSREQRYRQRRGGALHHRVHGSDKHMLRFAEQHLVAEEWRQWHSDGYLSHGSHWNGGAHTLRELGIGKQCVGDAGRHATDRYTGSERKPQSAIRRRDLPNERSIFLYQEQRKYSLGVYSLGEL